jgi:sterol desaturase/sphingolipid hydroxylase (fatty acid hydroxylase superfamily)
MRFYSIKIRQLSHHGICSDDIVLTRSDSSSLSGILPWSSSVVWPLMMTLPLLMTSSWSPTSYQQLFPASWYEYDPSPGNWPKPLGLMLGISAVAIGQVFIWIVFYAFKYGHLSMGDEPLSVQTKGARPYEFWEGLVTHISQPEGFVLLGAYLAGTWMLRLMPQSYYSFEGGIQWSHVFLCLAIQDAIQYVMHRLEHSVSPAFYQKSHKPHHKFTNPRLFDAFNGSMADTICMILIPLYVTANLVECNVWTYMAFGSAYANWLTLIHSEYAFPWDGLFHAVRFGTPADHHVHHAFFKFNYGHLFMWSDMICGTYKHPHAFAPRIFNENV